MYKGLSLYVTKMVLLNTVHKCPYHHIYLVLKTVTGIYKTSYVPRRGLNGNCRRLIKIKQYNTIQSINRIIFISTYDIVFTPCFKSEGEMYLYNLQ